MDFRYIWQTFYKPKEEHPVAFLTIKNLLKE